MTDKLQAVREAVIKANPKLEGRNTSIIVPSPFDGLINFRDKTIRLADVLLVLAPLLLRYGSFGYEQFMISDSKQGNCLWNLRNDDLTAQSPETIDFLFELLSPENVASKPSRQ